ncbi:NUDIX hydrolase [Convivina intestini]|uniref:NUDIX hydrolase n=1 Tax=Convivina intestini TaxID=1505726 RepID=UPI00200E09BD|nr:NUDIX hydrolase [Convivina intestini]CAH1852661.1 ADP-ribose pyrophosphatase [Convivina intestini]
MRILKDKTVYQGAVFEVKDQVIDLENQREPIKRQSIITSDSITIALINEARQVLIVNEFRAPIASFSWSLPAGRVNSEEAPAVTAQRELAEETGYLIESEFLHRVDRVSLSNGILSEFSNIYLAHLVDRHYQLVDRHFDHDEDIRDQKWVSIDAALTQTDGAASHLALLYVKLV